MVEQIGQNIYAMFTSNETSFMCCLRPIDYTSIAHT